MRLLKKCVAFVMALIMMMGIIYIPSEKVTATDAKLVHNGGFEDDLADWDNWSDSSKFGITTEVTEVHEGAKALKVTSNSQDWVGLSQDVSVKPHTDYVLTFYGKNASMFCYKIIDQNWERNLVEEYPNGVGDYTEYTAIFNSESNNKVILYISDSATDGFYDNFSIVESGPTAIEVPNGNFESGSLNWINTDAPEKFQITTDTDKVYEGNYALAIESATQDWSNIKLIVPVNPFYKYKISFYSKGENTTFFKVLNATAMVELIGGIPRNNSDEWTLNTYEFGSGSNENVVLYFADTAGEVYIDNISIEELEAEPQIKTEVVNGDFETGDLTSWNDSNASDKFKVVRTVSGSALSIVSSSQDWNCITQQISVEKGTNYSISLKAGGSGVYYKVATTDWGDTFVEGTTSTTSGSALSYLKDNNSSTFNTGNNERISLAIYDSKGNAYVDDITINKREIIPINGRTEVNANGTIKEIDLVDFEATDQTKSLYAYLKDVGKNNLLFGHQNDNYQTIVNKDGIASDTYHVVGAFPSIVGFDLIGFEGNLDELVDLIKDAYNKNSIITLCDHTPNFTSGGSFNDITPTIEHILPGGKDNVAFEERMDMIAYVSEQCTDTDGNKIPIIYRPFHENSGMWFWWGVSNSTKDQFVNLWRYTVEYLRDVKYVDNFLYAYSPNGHFSSEADYLSRYPGDDYVDIIGFDVYHDNPSYESKWMAQTKQDAQIAVSIANSKNKVAAITEVGLRHNGSDGLAVENNAVKDWYMLLHNTLMNDSVAKEIAYIMTWRNQDKSHFWVPYDDGVGDRHEMADEFARFYNQDSVIFADRLGNVYNLNIDTVEKETSAYIFAPITAEKIKGSKYQAKVKVMEGKSSIQSVIIKLGEKEYTTVLNDGYYIATIDTTRFMDGDILLSARVTLANSETIELAKSIKVMNNDSNDNVDTTVLDNYDGYYGDNDFLRESYNRNTNGDLNDIELISSPFGEDLGYAMQFTYSVASGGPGYSGVSKTLNYDISSLDAEGISFWIQGDGQGQDILLQLSIPDSYEAHLNDLDDFDQLSTEPQYLEIPWSAFVKKGHTNPMDLTKIQAFAFYVNGTNIEDSVLVFDEVKFLIPEAKPTPIIPPTSTTPSTPVVSSPNPLEDEKILEAIKKSNSKEATIDMKGNTKLLKEFLEGLKGLDKKITLDIGDGIQWIFNTKDLEKLEFIETIDLGVAINTKNIPSDAVKDFDDKENKQITLTHNGDFGFKVTLKIDMKKNNKGQIANLFYYNPDAKTLELNSIGLVNEDGMVELSFNHASDYLIVLDKKVLFTDDDINFTVIPEDMILYLDNSGKSTIKVDIVLPDLLQHAVDNKLSDMKVEYSTSDMGIAQVNSNGKVTAKKSGKSTITTTLTIDGIIKTFDTIIVVKATENMVIEIIEAKASMKLGETFTFKLMGHGFDKDDIVWKTTEKSVVVINKATGKATAKSAGTDYVVACIDNLTVRFKVVVISTDINTEDNTKDSKVSIYVVKRGDTLSAIASKNGCTVSDLIRLNNMKNPNYIRTGQKIAVPE